MTIPPADQRPPESGTSFSPRRIGLVGGFCLLALLLTLPPPADLSPEGWRTAAIAVLMAVWWLTEAIPIPATALLPLGLFPLLGVLDMPDAAAPYAHELIFLFMGGFLLAAAMERWGLHRRIALGIVSAVGTGPRRVVLGFMVATAFLSMWISNTATTAMMFPIGLAVGEIFLRRGGGGAATEGVVDSVEGGGAASAGATAPAPASDNIGLALMLGIAYAASIGGVATLIGTPPNAVLAGAADELLGIRIGFLEWMAVGLPFALLLLPVTWFLLVRVLYPVPGRLAGTERSDDVSTVLEGERRALGPPDRGERIVATVFVLTAVAWIMREPKVIGGLTIPGIGSFAPSVRDSTIAILAALLLFVLPVRWREGIFALDWPTARRIPWGVLVLFGGGLSLARAMDQSGLAAWIGGLVSGFGDLPLVALIGVVALLFVFLTEVTSNTATSTMAMPVMAGAALGLGVEPLPLMVTAALAASMAFMLPVATPPNAIVFGAEYVTIPRMARAGFWLNLIAVATISALAPFLVTRFLGG